MVRAAEAAFSKGWKLIKVYAMIGLPTETDDDLEELARLAEDILAAGRRVTGGRKIQIKVSVGCFVPKAWTPFQWQPYAGVGELRHHFAQCCAFAEPHEGECLGGVHRAGRDIESISMARYGKQPVKRDDVLSTSLANLDSLAFGEANVITRFTFHPF